MDMQQAIKVIEEAGGRVNDKSMIFWPSEFEIDEQVEEAMDLLINEFGFDLK